MQTTVRDALALYVRVQLDLHFQNERHSSHREVYLPALGSDALREYQSLRWNCTQSRANNKTKIKGQEAI